MSNERVSSGDHDGPIHTTAARLASWLGSADRIERLAALSAQDAIEREAWGLPEAAVVPDAAMCDDCTREIENPRARRFGYAFASCSRCGPRLTLATGGAVLAIKGVGGFHLACDATSSVAIRRLRQRKAGEQSAFPLMARNLAVVERYCKVGSAARAAARQHYDRHSVVYDGPMVGRGKPGALVSLTLMLSALTTTSGAQQPVTIVLTGQSMIRSDLRATAAAAVPRIQALLQGDVIYTHLEAAVAESGESVRQGRGFLTPAESLDALQALGFNLLSLSGNHAFDLGAIGIANTLRETSRRHIVHAGTGDNLDEAAAPAYLHTGNMTIALVASASGLITPGASATAERPGVNELRVNAGAQLNEATTDLPGAPANAPDAQDAARILNSIRMARQHADLVIVYQHNHVFADKAFSTLFNEGLPERLAPNEWLRKWTHQEVEAGADIVVMHGAPLLHGVEVFKGRPIFYDLGNFIYNLPPTLIYIDEPISWESVVARVQFRGRDLQSITLLPITLNAIGEGQPDAHDPYTNNEFLDTRGLPSAATGAKANYILERLASLSKPFGTRVELHGGTGRVVLEGR